MEKSATLNLRVNPEVKKKAEEVLNTLGVSMSSAIDMYLYQISLTGGIPFPITIPSKEVNADIMSKDELLAKIKKGVSDIESGRTKDAKSVFNEILEQGI